MEPKHELRTDVYQLGIKSGVVIPLEDVVAIEWKSTAAANTCRLRFEDGGTEYIIERGSQDGMRSNDYNYTWNGNLIFTIASPLAANLMLRITRKVER